MDTLGDDQLITGSYDGTVRVWTVPTESAEGASATCTRTLSGIHTGLLVSGDVSALQPPATSCRPPTRRVCSNSFALICDLVLHLPT